MALGADEPDGVIAGFEFIFATGSVPAPEDVPKPDAPPDTDE